MRAGSVVYSVHGARCDATARAGLGLRLGAGRPEGDFGEVFFFLKKEEEPQADTGVDPGAWRVDLTAGLFQTGGGSEADSGDKDGLDSGDE